MSAGGAISNRALHLQQMTGRTMSEDAGRVCVLSVGFVTHTQTHMRQTHHHGAEHDHTYKPQM